MPYMVNTPCGAMRPEPTRSLRREARWRRVVRPASHPQDQLIQESQARRHNGMVPGTSTGEGSWTSSGLDFLISVDRRGRGLGAALQQAVRDAIRGGRLHPGDPLPSTRALARDLGVARGTAVEAYEPLVAAGRLVARPGPGTPAAGPPAPPP